MSTNHGQPAWITQPLSPYVIAQILNNEMPERRQRRDHEPLDSGCYLPAVEYGTAAAIMQEHGDDVIAYLRAHGGLPVLSMTRYSWNQLPCFYLSRAVLAFAQEHAALADWENDKPINLEES